jgi:bacteriocin-like protein
MTKVTIGLKKKSESGAKQDQQPDIELTEEDLKQIAGGTTKGIQLRPGAGLLDRT